MAIRFDQIQLSDDGNHLYPYIAGTDGYLAVQTTSGLLRIGAANSSYSHFYTDRASYYFNTAVAFDGNINAYDGNENLSNWNNIDASAFRSKADTNYYLDPDNTGTSLKAAGTVHASNSNMSSYQLNGTYVMDSSRNLVNIVGITSTGNAVFGNSNTDKVVVHGHLGIGDDAYPKIAYPGQNALWSGSGSTTGQIVIDLPGTLANYDMMYMEIDVYEYSSDHATKIIVGGHNWNSGGNSNTSTTMWYNAGVRVIGSMSKPIYLGRRNDGSNERRCIAIGETTSTWSYATVHVHKVHGAEFYATAIDWVGDWNIAQTTSTSYFTKNPTTNFNLNSSTTLRTNGRFYAQYVQAATEVIAPIFYDSGDTTYYLNPASTGTAINLAGEAHIGGKVGINTTDPNGQGYSYAEDLVILGGNSASDGVGITLRGNGKTYGVIAFGDNADDNAGEIYYAHNNDTMSFRAATGVQLVLTSTTIDGQDNQFKTTRSDGFRIDSSSYARIELDSNDNWSYIRFMDNGSVSWDVATLDAGNLELRPGGGGSNRTYFDSSGNSYSETSKRAPIFYDLDSTSYYLDPASSSIALKINGIIDQSFEQTNLNTAWTTPGSSFAQGFIVGRYQSTASNIPSNNDNANWFMNIYSHSTGGTASYGIQLAGSNANSGENALSLRNVSNGSFGSWRKVYHEGHKPTYTELGTMAYSNLTGTPTIPTDFVSAASGGTFSDDITIDGGTSTTLSVKCDNGGNAMVRVNGDGQGTGIVEVGQSNDYGGGMSYNGDGSPSFVSGETADHITFYRLDNGTRTEVFHYPYNSSTVNFNATPTIGGVNIAKISDVPTNNNQLTNGAGYITTDTNYYLDGISKSGNTLTFSVNGATNQTYTFGSNAFNSTTIPTNTNQLTNGAGFITTSATVDHANNLNATDDRDMAPEDYGYSNDLRIFFSAREGLEDGTSTGSDWQDVLYLNSYSDSSGGSANILAFDKSAGTYIIRHYQAAQSASNWGTPKTLAYTDDLGHKCTFTEDSAAGNDISSRIASGFYETNTPTASEGYPSTTELGSSSWAHLLSSTHSNNSNYYAMQFTGSFFNQSLFHRQTNGSGTTDWLRVAQHKDTTVQSGDWLRADKFYTYNDTTRYVDPANTSLMKNINVYGLIGLNGYGNFGHCNGSGGNMLGFNNSNAAGATLGVNKSGQVYEYEKIFTFKVSGSGWVNRYSNPFKLIQAPGADKMIIVDEFLVYIDYETRTGLGGTGIAHGGHTNAYSVGFYESESGQSQSTAANGTSGTFYTLGVMPRNFMATTLDRGYYRDVPVHQSALIANRSLFFRTAQNCGSSGNAPGGAHYIKIKYRVVDISDEFSDSGVDYTLSSSSYHGQYAHSADGNKQYNDNGSANC